MGIEIEFVFVFAEGIYHSSYIPKYVANQRSESNTIYF